MKAFMMKTGDKWHLNGASFYYASESDKEVAEYALSGGGMKGKTVHVLDGAGKFLYAWRRTNKWYDPELEKVVRCSECGTWKRFKEVEQ